MSLESTSDRAKRLSDQLLDAMKRPDDAALVEAHERNASKTAVELQAFYARTGQARAPAVPLREASAEPVTRRKPTRRLAALGLIADAFAVLILCLSRFSGGSGLGWLSAEEGQSIALIVIVAAFALHARSYGGLREDGPTPVASSMRE